jgi:hypothetical protein
LKIFNPYVQEVRDSRLPMLVFSPIIKDGEDMLDRLKLKNVETITTFLIIYFSFLICYLNSSLPWLKPLAMINVVKIENEKFWNVLTTSPLGDRGGHKKIPVTLRNRDFLLFEYVKNRFLKFHYPHQK